MQRSKLFAGTALALLMCAVPAFAQQKGGEEKSSPAQAQSGESKEHGTSQKGQNKATAKEGREQNATQNEGKDKGAQTVSYTHLTLPTICSV